MKGKGLNEFVFNAHLPVARKNSFLTDNKEKQIQKLAENKGAFSAGGQWCHIGLELQRTKEDCGCSRKEGRDDQGKNDESKGVSSGISE